MRRPRTQDARAGRKTASARKSQFRTAKQRRPVREKPAVKRATLKMARNDELTLSCGSVSKLGGSVRKLGLC